MPWTRAARWVSLSTLLTRATVLHRGWAPRDVHTITPTSLLFKRYGHSSGVRTPAFGSGRRRRGQPRSPRSGRCAIEGHRQSPVCLADRHFDLRPQIVAAGFLPGRAAHVRRSSADGSRAVSERFFDALQKLFHPNDRPSRTCGGGGVNKNKMDTWRSEWDGRVSPDGQKQEAAASC
jgi:hypothetical protein